MLPTLSLLPGLALMTLAGFYGSARDDIASRPAPVTNSVSIASISSDSAALSLTIGASSAVTRAFKDAQARVIPALGLVAITLAASVPHVVALSSASVTVQAVAAGAVILIATCEGKSVAIAVALTQAGWVTSLVVLSNSVWMLVYGTLRFTVSGRTTGDPSTVVPVNAAYPANGGAITAIGLFTAGAQAASGFRVTATLSDTGAMVPRAADTVTPPPVIPVGVWTNVTPGNVDLTRELSCGNFGVENVQVDPKRPSDFYAQFHCQGIWKSVDYGKTWVGPINTGRNGSTVSDCAGGIRIAPGSTASPATLYLSCIRGAATGFWRSLDGGVSWSHYAIAPAAGNRQDVYAPSADPYDARHLIMAGHEQDLLVESIDGGQKWTRIAMHAGMLVGNGTGSISFINTGSATTTRGTFLWMAQHSGGTYGTWRTTDGGASWTQVDKNEHPHGFAEVYQPDAGGVVYMAGAYSLKGWGVLRSTDYGVTWAHVGASGNQRVVFGTPKNVYSAFSYPTGLGASDGPSLQMAAQPGTGPWTPQKTPAAMKEGATQVAVGFDGTHYHLVSAHYGSGLWLYIEP